MRPTIFFPLVGGLIGGLACFFGIWVTTQHAQPVRLIGECGGRFYAAMEESAFPSGCEWIEPIRVDVQ